MQTHLRAVALVMILVGSVGTLTRVIPEHPFLSALVTVIVVAGLLSWSREKERVK